ncbi:hypothetical protein [Microbacterium dauci]|uniref:Amino acid transporter n=1 Tax=Microbacterium dauci TaxID=3048008 RepID=A0ABT6ZDA9_9MICO|nr:hypothetical protein [Microbacterium sp. LX3-4]MDJ1114142.1 hypothetical protein [Microbacterium sp. LX3-4]
MTEKDPTRRQLLRPAQLITMALIAAAFAGIVTLVSMGILQDPRPVPEGALHPHVRAWMVAAIVAGVTFIATLVIIALSLLAVDPSKVGKTVDRGLLLDPEPGPGDDDRPAAPREPRGH